MEVVFYRFIIWLFGVEIIQEDNQELGCLCILYTVKSSLSLALSYLSKGHQGFWNMMVLS